jgi:hypothetical protein
MTKLEFLFKQHEAILGWYKHSDEKAKFLVTLNTVTVGVVNGLVFIGADRVRAARPVYTLPIWILLALCGVALIASYLFILRAMWPRHHSGEVPLSKTERTWFFGHLASTTKEQYAAALADWTEQDLEAALISQNQIVSKNVWAKHEALNRAIAITLVALMLLFALGVAYGIAVATAPLPTGRGGGG